MNMNVNFSHHIIFEISSTSATENEFICVLELEHLNKLIFVLVTTIFSFSEELERML